MNDDNVETAGRAAADDGMVVDNRSPYMTLVGPVLRRGSADVFVVHAQEKHNNVAGVVHGGVLATLLDNVMGRVATKAVGGKPVATIQLNTYFLSSVAPGDSIECEARVVRAGASIVFMQGTLRVGSRIVATGDGVWKILN